MKTLVVAENEIRLDSKVLCRYPTVDDISLWLGESPECYASLPFRVPGYSGNVLVWLWKKNGVFGSPGDDINFPGLMTDAPRTLTRLRFSFVPGEVKTEDDSLLMVKTETVPPHWIRKRRQSPDPGQESELPVNNRFHATFNGFPGELVIADTKVTKGMDVPLLGMQLASAGWDTKLSTSFHVFASRSCEPRIAQCWEEEGETGLVKVDLQFSSEALNASCWKHRAEAANDLLSPLSTRGMELFWVLWLVLLAPLFALGWHLMENPDGIRVLGLGWDPAWGDGLETAINFSLRFLLVLIGGALAVVAAAGAYYKVRERLFQVPVPTDRKFDELARERTIKHLRANQVFFSEQAGTTPSPSPNSKNEDQRKLLHPTNQSSSPLDLHQIGQNFELRSHPLHWLNPANWLVFPFRSVIIRDGYLVVKDGLFGRHERNIRLDDLPDLAHTTYLPFCSWLFGGAIEVSVRGSVAFDRKQRPTSVGHNLYFSGIRKPEETKQRLLMARDAFLEYMAVRERSGTP